MPLPKNINTGNFYGITMVGANIITVRPIPCSMDTDTARLIAAWLVTMAEVCDSIANRTDAAPFADVLEAVQNT